MKKEDKTLYTSIAFYPVVVEPQAEGGYIADCPSLQGCHAEGDTLGEAIDNIKSVIDLHIEARRKFNDPLPAVRMPRSLEMQLTIPIPVNA